MASWLCSRTACSTIKSRQQILRRQSSRTSCCEIDVILPVSHLLKLRRHSSGCAPLMRYRG
eukprot:6472326-Prorocentrum_lima.AAC.1